jgi:hypothetical protein
LEIGGLDWKLNLDFDWIWIWSLECKMELQIAVGDHRGQMTKENIN